VRIFGFIAAKKVELSISIMCRVLSVSRSGFDAWHEREPCARALEDERLTSRIREIHGCNRGVYGSAMPSCRSSTASGSGASASQRLMRAAGLSGLQAKRWRRTTIRVPGVGVCEDLVDRAFAAEGPDRIWVADITYLRRWEGWL
jgi:putative transposase